MFQTTNQKLSEIIACTNVLHTHISYYFTIPQDTSLVNDCDPPIAKPTKHHLGSPTVSTANYPEPCLSIPKSSQFVKHVVVSRALHGFVWGVGNHDVAIKCRDQLRQLEASIMFPLSIRSYGGFHKWGYPLNHPF